MTTRPRNPLKWAVLGLMVPVMLALSGCLGMGEGVQTTIVPESDYGRMIHDLYVLVFWLAVAVFVVVEAALIWAVVRYRRRVGDPDPAQIHGNTRLEVAWTVAPAVVLFIIAIPTIEVLFAAESREVMAPAHADPVEIVVTGYQWWWRFEYPEHQVVTANEAHIPAGRPVIFRLRSADVVHSFWIPRLGGKTDVVPQRENVMYLTADAPGYYYGQCAEFCGLQHANMRLRVIVDTPEGFDAWIQQQQQPPPPPEGLAAAGSGLFVSRACVACHTVRGTDARGVVGPDLTNFGSRTTVAAGMLDNTTENLARWLRSPQEVKPGNQMPDLHLTEPEIEALVAYLQSLR